MTIFSATENIIIVLIRLLEIKYIRVGNSLPALILAPLMLALLTALNISLLP